MPERELRQRIRAALKRTFPGALVLQWPSNMWTGPGWPDLLYSEWPLLVGFEIKHGRKSKPTPIQRSRHVELRNHHVPVYVVYGPDDAVDTITTLKEKLPMAFDPALLAELDAALTASPEPDLNEAPASIAANGALADVELEELPTFDDVVIEGEDSVPGTEEIAQAEPDDQNASWLDKGPFAGMSGDDARMLATVDALNALQQSADALTQAVRDLMTILGPEASTPDVPQTAEAPAPRRRTRRS